MGIDSKKSGSEGLLVSKAKKYWTWAATVTPIVVATIYLKNDTADNRIKQEENQRAVQARDAEVQKLLGDAEFAVIGDGALGLNLSCKPTAEQKRRFKEGRLILSEAQKLAPEDPRIIGAFGSTYLTECKWQKAEDHLNRCIELDPKNAMCHQQLGKALQRQGKPGYLAHYRIARQLQPDDLNIAMEIAADLRSDVLLIKLLRENPDDIALQFEAARPEIERELGPGSVEKLQTLAGLVPRIAEGGCAIDDSKLAQLESHLREQEGADHPPALEDFRQQLLDLMSTLRQQRELLGCGSSI